MKTFIIKIKSSLEHFTYFGRTNTLTVARYTMRALGYKPNTYELKELTGKDLEDAELAIFAKLGFAESSRVLFGRQYFNKISH